MKLCRLEYCENYIYCKDDKKGVCGLDENYLVDDMTECYEDIRELCEFLELDKSQWAIWTKKE